MTNTDITIESPKELARVTSTLWLISLVTIIITFLIVFFKINPNSQSTYALHYSVLVGVDLLGSGRNFYKLPGISFAIFIVNYFIFRYLKSPRNLLSFFLSLFACIVSAVMLSATLFLIRVN